MLFTVNTLNSYLNLIAVHTVADLNPSGVVVHAVQDKINEILNETFTVIVKICVPA